MPMVKTISNSVIMAGLILLIAGNAAAQEGQPRLAQVIYITMSKACSCTLERCQAGDVVVGNVFNGKGKDLLRRIDYSTDKETARDYMKKYGITQAPALLFLDTRENLLWMALGELTEKEIAEKLRQFGG